MTTAADREKRREALTLRDILNREPVELGEGVTPQQVIALALATIDLGYRVHPENGRANMLAVEADWIMQQWAKTEAWAKDEQAKRHAAEDKLVDARSSIARLSAEVEALRKERDEARAELDLAALARDAAGYLGTISDCIHDLSVDADDCMVANARADRLAAEIKTLQDALEPFVRLEFLYDGFSLDPAELVVAGDYCGRFPSQAHAHLQKSIDAARAAYARTALAAGQDKTGGGKP